jgi:hypothetical protein
MGDNCLETLLRKFKLVFCWKAVVDIEHSFISYTHDDLTSSFNATIFFLE